jgi:hypothetical protein
MPILDKRLPTAFERLPAPIEDVPGVFKNVPTAKEMLGSNNGELAINDNIPAVYEMLPHVEDVPELFENALAAAKFVLESDTDAFGIGEERVQVAEVQQQSLGSRDGISENIERVVGTVAKMEAIGIPGLDYEKQRSRDSRRWKQSTRAPPNFTTLRNRTSAYRKPSCTTRKCLCCRKRTASYQECPSSCRGCISKQ